MSNWMVGETTTMAGQGKGYVTCANGGIFFILKPVYRDPNLQAVLLRRNERLQPVRIQREM
jgi:hypothetical protein